MTSFKLPPRKNLIFMLSQKALCIKLCFLCVSKCVELHPACNFIIAQGITGFPLRTRYRGDSVRFSGKYLTKRSEPGLAPSGVWVSFMSPRLQAVLLGVSVLGYNSVRDGRVWGTTGVSEPSLVWASESLNKKER